MSAMLPYPRGDRDLWVGTHIRETFKAIKGLFKRDISQDNRTLMPQQLPDAISRTAPIPEEDHYTAVGTHMRETLEAVRDLFKRDIAEDNRTLMPQQLPDAVGQTLPNQILGLMEPLPTTASK